MTSDHYGFPVKLGQDLSRHAGRWMWRIAVTEPDTMAAAWFTHDTHRVAIDPDIFDFIETARLVVVENQIWSGCKND